MRTKLTSNGHVVVGMPLSIEDAAVLRAVCAWLERTLSWC